ncbi:G-protein coupled receptor 83-like [Notamacropus eugenii]|uniref:G-protein coupled receptor 83-like n=1 Tax=Notamacropus eugenii TaxID=9315 RepID=UPI003B67ADA5
MASVLLSSTPSGLGEFSKSPPSPGPTGLLDGMALPLPSSLPPSPDVRSTTFDPFLGRPDFSSVAVPTELMGSKMRGLFILAYFSIIWISLFGNSVVCSVVLRRKQVHTATGFLIVNLAVANLLITVLNIPFTLVSFISSTWIFGYMMCHLSRFIQYCSIYVSVLTLTAIALDQHQITLQPLKPRMSTMKGAVCVVIIWVIASFFSVPHAIYQEFPLIDTVNKTNRMSCLPTLPRSSDGIRKYLDLVTFLFLFILPLLVIFITYSIMAKKIWVQNAVQDMTSEQSVNQQQKRKMILKMLVMVVVVFSICWFPLHFYEVLLSNRVIYSHEAVYFIFHWFAMSSTCYNPLIYYWLNKSFRREFILVLRSLWQRMLTDGQPSISPTVPPIIEDSYLFSELSFGMLEANEGLPPHDQIDPSGIHAIVEVPQVEGDLEATLPSEDVSEAEAKID